MSYKYRLSANKLTTQWYRLMKDRIEGLTALEMRIADAMEGAAQHAAAQTIRDLRACWRSDLTFEQMMVVLDQYQEAKEK